MPLVDRGGGRACRRRPAVGGKRAAGGEPAEQLLADCYCGALRLADREGLHSVAFPAISTGAFGYPMEEAARVAIRAVLDTAGDLRSVDAAGSYSWARERSACTPTPSNKHSDRIGASRRG